MAPKEYDGTDQEFLAAWRKAKVADGWHESDKQPDPPRPSARQYRKWLQGRGQAFNARNQ